MGNLKITAYGTLTEDNERLVLNYLEDKGMTVTVHTVDPLNETIRTQGRIISDQKARIEELEAEDDE